MEGFDAIAEHVRAAARNRSGPLLVGVTGAVGVGKTTLARRLAERCSGGGLDAAVLGTDGFLLPNTVLAERGLLARKGFPETFDLDALAGALERLRDGVAADVPVYSHETFDIVPGAAERVEAAAVVLVEGVVVLHPDLVPRLDVRLFLDADEADVRAWFVERFLALCEAAGDDPASFYRRFAGRSPAELRDLAEQTWDTINGPNLRQHIAPARRRADLVVTFDADRRPVRVGPPT